jgi:hypothetical protein
MTKALVVGRSNDLVCAAEMMDKDYPKFLSKRGTGPKNGNVF